MQKWILVLLIIALFAGTATATFTPGDYNRSLQTVTGLKGSWLNSCAAFTWDAATGADFNNYILTITSNNSALALGDLNTNVNSKSLCTLQDGEWVRMVVYRVDGNSEGRYLNILPDANFLVKPGTMLQSGSLIMFNIMVSLGTLFSLLLIVIVTILLLKHIGFKDPLQFK